jgi:hypothetical protein
MSRSAGSPVVGAEDRVCRQSIAMSGGGSVTSDRTEFITPNGMTLGLVDDRLETTRGHVTSPYPHALREDELQAYIGRELRSLYDHILSEDIPEFLLHLINDLQIKQIQK